MSSTFCYVLGDTTKEDSKQQRIVVNSNAVGWDSKWQKENIPPSKMSQRPRQHHFDAELDAMRRQGLCFKRGDKCSKSHEAVCPNKEFHVLTVLNGFEVEMLDSEPRGELNEAVIIPELKTLSLCAYWVCRK